MYLFFIFVAARCALVAQNLSVALCAVVVCFVFWFNSEIAEYWPDLLLLQLCHGLIILIAIIANLASIAGTIAMEKDWLVQLCGTDRDLLASKYIYICYYGNRKLYVLNLFC